MHNGGNILNKIRDLRRKTAAEQSEEDGEKRKFIHHQ